MTTHAYQQAFEEYSYLDLTSDIVNEALEQIGGGGFSDIFRTRLRAGWQARNDPHIERLLSETGSIVSISESDPNCVFVAVKRLRLWGRPIPKIEKVSHSLLSVGGSD